MTKITAIKENHVFSRAYAKGKRAAARTVVVYALKNYRTRDTRLGITASRKLGNAVQRSRARRLIREAFRHIASEREFVRPFDLIVVARGALFDKKRKMQDARADLEEAFSSLGLFRPGSES